SGADAKTCNARDAEAADLAVDKLNSWKDVEQNFRKLGHCDSGSIAEGNSEAVARLLADQWPTLTALTALVKRTPSFEAYVVRHVDSTLNTKDLDKIAKLASSECPEGMTALCEKIKAAAVRASRQ